MINIKWLNILLVLSILISILSFVFIAVFSAESGYIFLHMLFVKLAFRSLFVHSVIQTFVVFKIPEFDKFLSFTTLLFTIILMVFLIIMDFGPSPYASQNSLLRQVTAQKVMVASIMIYFFFQIRTALSVP